MLQLNKQKWSNSNEEANEAEKKQKKWNKKLTVRDIWWAKMKKMSFNCSAGPQLFKYWEFSLNWVEVGWSTSSVMKYSVMRSCVMTSREFLMWWTIIFYSWTSMSTFGVVLDGWQGTRFRWTVLSRLEEPEYLRKHNL